MKLSERKGFRQDTRGLKRDLEESLKGIERELTGHRQVTAMLVKTF